MLDRINAVFNHEGMRKRWLRIRIPVGVLIICLLVPLVRREYFFGAAAISLIGELIQLWCFAALDKGRSLACRGPYAFVRNPMYLGRYFIVLGFVVLLGKPGLWLLLPFTIFYWFYMRNRVAREEEFLAGALGEDYAAYCGRVNRFLPTFTDISGKAMLYWNWSLFTRNHGWTNLIALLAVYAVLYLISGWLG
jgi:protein-S-isoprenylcysteine O-methyltransferase Ste14